jgi:sugar lactone lactonase YvrE
MKRGDHAIGARRAVVWLLAFMTAGAGCASKWVMRTVEPPSALQWPFPPSPAKVTYVQSLTGFATDTDARSVARAIVFGREDPARNAFVLPVAVATGGDGRIGVADMGRRCVHLYVPAERRYVRLSGSEGDPVTSPVGLVFDEQSTLYLSDSAGKVFAFAADGAVRFVLRDAGGEPLQRPTGIAYSPQRKLLYVVDTLAHRVHALRTTGEQAFSFGERGEGENGFNFPTHIFRSPAGELYVTDALNFRIRIFDEDGKPLASFGRHGDGSGDLAMPKGIAVDRDGVIYVVDGVFDNVQLFDRKGEFLLTLGQRGVGFAEFWLPSGAFIKEDTLYVCDTYNARIQVFRVTGGYEDRRGTS